MYQHHFDLIFTFCLHCEHQLCQIACFHQVRWYCCHGMGSAPRMDAPCGDECVCNGRRDYDVAARPCSHAGSVRLHVVMFVLFLIGRTLRERLPMEKVIRCKPYRSYLCKHSECLFRWRCVCYVATVLTDATGRVLVLAGSHSGSVRHLTNWIWFFGGGERVWYTYSSKPWAFGDFFLYFAMGWMGGELRRKSIRRCKALFLTLWFEAFL